MSTVVLVHAHPDDESLITGGTIAALSRVGHRVVVITCTDGESGLADESFGGGSELAGRRVRELENACRVLGVHRLVRLGHVDSGSDKENLRPDGFCYTDVETVAAQIAEVVREEKADLLVGYDPAGGYGHPDHVQVHRVALRARELSDVPRYLEATVDRRAIMLAARVLRWIPGARRLVPADGFANSWSGDGLTATVDVRDQATVKRAALRCHASQASGASVRTVSLLSRMYGPLGRVVLGSEWFTGPGPVRAARGDVETLFG